jgi:hypothetical protein
MTNEEQINEIMDNFDFHKVHFARVWVDDGYGERNMALDDLEHA